MLTSGAEIIVAEGQGKKQISLSLRLRSAALEKVNGVMCWALGFYSSSQPGLSDSVGHMQGPKHGYFFFSLEVPRYGICRESLKECRCDGGSVQWMGR